MSERLLDSDLLAEFWHLSHAVRPLSSIRPRKSLARTDGIGQIRGFLRQR